MERVPVTSTSISSIGYDAKSQTLEVEFVNGGVYLYMSVPPEVHDGFLKAESKGTFYVAHVRNDYPFQKIS